MPGPGLAVRLVALWLAWGCGACGADAAAATYPVRPRPQCSQPFDGKSAQPKTPRAAHSPRLPADCLGPIDGARAAPKRHAGRQQQRMRACQQRAGWLGLSGQQRTQFVRECLHRGR